MAKSRIAIIGLGWIGGSIGLALKKAKLDVEIVGHDKDNSVAGRAQKRGAVDRTNWNLPGTCEGAGLVIIALPLAGVKDTLEALRTELEPGTIVTDTASTKLPVMEWASRLTSGVQFIGGNPILRSEPAAGARGIDAADPNLFQGASYALTASPAASPQAMETMVNFCGILGAKPLFIDAAEHDGLTAGTQHLPALLSLALEAATMQSQGWRELGKLAGVDFSTATGLAPSDAKTASAELLSHKADLVRWIDLVQGQLRDLRGMIERGDQAGIEALVSRVADERDRWQSGALNREGETHVDLPNTQFNLGRLFIGSLAERGKKK